MSKLKSIICMDPDDVAKFINENDDKTGFSVQSIVYDSYERFYVVFYWSES